MFFVCLKQPHARLMRAASWSEVKLRMMIGLARVRWTGLPRPGNTVDAISCFGVERGDVKLQPKRVAPQICE